MSLNVKSIGEGAESLTKTFKPKPFNRSFAYTLLSVVLKFNKNKK